MVEKLSTSSYIVGRMFLSGNARPKPNPVDKATKVFDRSNSSCKWRLVRENVGYYWRKDWPSEAETREDQLFEAEWIKGN